MCPRHQCRGNHMVRGLVERCREAKDVVLAGVAEGIDAGDGSVAACQGAGLVDDQRARPGKRLQRSTALYQHADPGRARDACDDSYRHGEDKRAGRRYHHHRQPALRVAGRQPRRAGNGQRRDEEAHGVPVGQPHHRRLLARRRFDQPHDAGVGTFRRRARHDEVEGFAGVGGAAHHRCAGSMARRQALAGQRRLVEHGFAAVDGAVCRHDFAAADHCPVAGHQRVDRYLAQFGTLVSECRLRRSIEQRRHLAPGSPRGDAFQELPARVHQGDHRAGERLAQHHSPAHR